MKRYGANLSALCWSASFAFGLPRRGGVCVASCGIGGRPRDRCCFPAWIEALLLGGGPLASFCSLGEPLRSRARTPDRVLPKCRPCSRIIRKRPRPNTRVGARVLGMTRACARVLGLHRGPRASPKRTRSVGLGAGQRALGAAVARPDRLPVAALGDGGGYLIAATGCASPAMAVPRLISDHAIIGF